jgi:MTH538 TIR-like domain (DUF1863)
MNTPRRKCFISYHHADEAEVSSFVRTFDHGRNLLIVRGLGTDMPGDVVNSTDTDYVMRRIRELYIKDSTVTLVMLGKCTWARRYVDWEIQASLYQREGTHPNGLLAIKLPSFPANGSHPDRFNKNLLTDENKKDWGDCYARHMSYPTSEQQLVDEIEEAYGRRTTHKHMIRNSRDRFGYNRDCK